MGNLLGSYFAGRVSIDRDWIKYRHGHLLVLTDHRRDDGRPVWDRLFDLGIVYLAELPANCRRHGPHWFARDAEQPAGQRARLPANAMDQPRRAAV